MLEPDTQIHIKKNRWKLGSNCFIKFIHMNMLTNH